MIFLECFLTLLTISCSSPSTQRKPVLFCLSFFMSDILHLSTTTNQCDKVQLTLICQPCYNNQDKQSARSCRGLCKGYFCPLPQKRKLQQLLYIHRDVDTYNKQMMICKAAALCCMSWLRRQFLSWNSNTTSAFLKTNLFKFQIKFQGIQIYLQFPYLSFSHVLLHQDSKILK